MNILDLLLGNLDWDFGRTAEIRAAIAAQPPWTARSLLFVGSCPAGGLASSTNCWAASASKQVAPETAAAELSWLAKFRDRDGAISDACLV